MIATLHRVDVGFAPSKAHWVIFVRSVKVYVGQGLPQNDGQGRIEDNFDKASKLPIIHVK